MGDSPGYRDRKTALVIFGILEILMGLSWLLAMIFGPFMVATKSDDLWDTWFHTLSPMFFAVVIILLGIGSVLARRWARALWLIFSWAWLLQGLGCFVGFVSIMPDFFQRLGAAGPIPEPAVGDLGWLAFLNGIMLFPLVLVPGVFVLFYRSQNVKATCEWRDLRFRWTDRRPLPVLAVAIFFGIFSLFRLLSGFQEGTVHLFGYALQGMARLPVSLVDMVVSAWVVWGAYRCRTAAWWAAFVLEPAWTVSNMVNFASRDAFSAESLQAMKQFGISPDSPIIIGPFAYSLVLWICFLLYSRRYFAA